MTIQKQQTLELLRNTVHLVAPPAQIGVDEWADEHRVLSPEASAEPGPWNTDRTPYSREPMRAISDPSVESVVLMWGAQLGKTDIQLNAIGYYTGHDPSPIMVIQPDLAVARDFSNDRLAPMYRDSEQLSKLVVKDKSRDSRNTILYKSFPGGRINIAGANAPASLASKPIRVVIGDEIDRFPASAGNEGDPVSLVTARTKTFYNKKLIWVSTPTIKDASRIEALYEDSTMEQLHLMCPSCDELQTLEWQQLNFDYDKDTSQCTRVEHVCKHCGALHSEHEWKKDYAIRSMWIPQKQHASVRGFKLSSLYATINVTWKDIVNDWYKANRGGPELLKTFVNTVLAESWEETGEKLEEEELLKRCEGYPAEVPDEVKVLTAAVDVQDDRLEVEVIGWGSGKESWGIEYHVLYGDLKQPAIWHELDEYLSRTWTNQDGSRFGIAITLIDSGGHFTTEVYRFCSTREARKIYALKGQGMRNGEYVPLINGHKRTKRERAVLFSLGVDEGKAKVFSNLRINEVGPGFCHFPLGRGYNLDYFKGLTAEVLKKKKHMGQTLTVWEKIRDRNEPLDLRVYNTAALEILNPNLDGTLEQSGLSNARKPRRRRQLSKGIQ